MDTDIDQAFGKRLRYLRKKRGLSMKQLAERVYISAGYVRAMEVGSKGVPSSTVLVRIAQVLGVRVEHLVGTDDPDSIRGPRLEHALELLESERRAGQRGFIEIAVVGTVPADHLRAIWPEGEGYTVSVPSEWLKGRSDDDVFALRVSGNCLASHHIVSGDLVICERPQGRQPQSGKLVIVRVGDELTLKIWHWRDDVVELSDGDGNVVYRTIPGEHLHVEGFVLRVMRNLEE